MTALHCVVCADAVRLLKITGEVRFGRQVKLRWVGVVSWGGGYVSCNPIFKIVSKIILGKTVCLSFSWLLGEASLWMANRSIVFMCEPLF